MKTKNIYDRDNSPLLVGIYITIFIVLLFLLSDNYKSPELKSASLFMAGISLLVALKAFQVHISSNAPASPAQQYVTRLIEDGNSNQGHSTQYFGDVNIISDSSISEKPRDRQDEIADIKNV
jgi:hypothetical protein